MKRGVIKEVLDKDALANEILVAKDELRMPYDYSAFTPRGKLTPDMIAKHTAPRHDARTSQRQKPC
jgi:hypothetical protein